jgi:hypothetical protein
LSIAVRIKFFNQFVKVNEMCTVQDLF